MDDREMDMGETCIVLDNEASIAGMLECSKPSAYRLDCNLALRCASLSDTTASVLSYGLSGRE